jgi:hypothetical protein
MKSNLNYVSVLIIHVLGVAPLLICLLQNVSASAFLSPIRQRTFQKMAPGLLEQNSGAQPPSIPTESETLKGELFALLDATPANAPTSRGLTDSILSTVQALEKSCPTPDEKVVPNLAGTWELLWTTQDRSSQEFNRLGPLRNWIK